MMPHLKLSNKNLISNMNYKYSFIYIEHHRFHQVSQAKVIPYQSFSVHTMTNVTIPVINEWWLIIYKLL